VGDIFILPLHVFVNTGIIKTDPINHNL